MMWSNGSGGWWLFALPMVIICMVMMVRMMGHGHSAQNGHTAASHAHRPDGPERILADRLARGEIDIEEYERRLAALRPTRDVDRT
jgi:putative membrane protein